MNTSDKFRQSQLWKYKVEDCDVEDKGKLKCYRTAASKWHQFLNSDQYHSIWSQIHGMMWTDAAWRVANEARRWTDEDGPTAATVPLLAGLLDRGHVATQVLAISKLTECSDPKRPKKGVVSLRRLVDEIVAQRSLFTREIYVCHDGLPYDWETVLQAELSNLPRADLGQAAVIIPGEGPTSWSDSERRHQEFDQLSNVAWNERSRTDVISNDIFCRLRNKIDDPVFTRIKSLRDKSIAHAADAFSRSFVTSDRHSITLVDFSQAHRCLISVAQAISAGLLFHSWHSSPISMPQYNQFENFDQPFVTEKRLKELRQFWRTHSDQVEEWTRTDYDNIISAINR